MIIQISVSINGRMCFKSKRCRRPNTELHNDLTPELMYTMRSTSNIRYKVHSVLDVQTFGVRSESYSSRPLQFAILVRVSQNPLQDESCTRQTPGDLSPFFPNKQIFANIEFTARNNYCAGERRHVSLFLSNPTHDGIQEHSQLPHGDNT